MILNSARTLLASAAIAAPLIGVVHAQLGKPLAFEVASVKPNKSLRFSEGMKTYPGGRLSATNVPLFLIITSAYQVAFQSPRLSGGPDWTRREGFDIEATAEKGAIPSNLPKVIQEAKLMSMLRSLLADRFKLVVRRETKEIPVYALVISKGGSKLQKAKLEEADCSFEPGPGAIPCHRMGGGQGRGINAQAVSLADVVRFVENWTDRPVIDKTGIQGLFEIKTEGWISLRASPEGAGGNGEGAADPDRPTLFTIFDRLGLKLERQKAPVEFFVIEHIERPTEN
jgi:uncharacterized protein (TIGR03435 family)